jgi:hypothetical protein
MCVSNRSENWAGCTNAPVRTVVPDIGTGCRRAAAIAVTNGRPEFGTWERIFYGESDGRRRKRVLVKIIGE